MCRGINDRVTYSHDTRIKYLVMDVDGTLTDGKIYMGCSGEIFKAFNIRDGYGIHELAPINGITTIIITGRNSDIVLNRSKELEVSKIYQGVSDKAKKLNEIMIDLSLVAYIGDDENDISAMLNVKKEGGIVGCPLDAVEKVKRIADFVADHNGGDGAVRDFIEWIVKEVNYV